VSAGDIACDADWKTTATQCRQRDTAKLIAEINPQIILALGDLHYTADKIDDWLGYDESWGSGKILPIRFWEITNIFNPMEHRDISNIGEIKLGCEIKGGTVSIRRLAFRGVEFQLR